MPCREPARQRDGDGFPRSRAQLGTVPWAWLGEFWGTGGATSASGSSRQRAAKAGPRHTRAEEPPGRPIRGAPSESPFSPHTSCTSHAWLSPARSLTVAPARALPAQRLPFPPPQATPNRPTGERRAKTGALRHPRLLSGGCGARRELAAPFWLLRHGTLHHTGTLRCFLVQQNTVCPIFSGVFHRKEKPLVGLAAEKCRCDLPLLLPGPR